MNWLEASSRFFLLPNPKAELTESETPENKSQFDDSSSLPKIPIFSGAVDADDEENSSGVFMISDRRYRSGIYINNMSIYGHGWS